MSGPARGYLSLSIWLVAFTALSGCHSDGIGPAGYVPSASREMHGGATGRDTSGGLDKIDHVVIIIQENRSLNNLFYGFPGAKTVTFGYDSENKKVTLKPIGLSTGWDLEHNSQGFYAACNGTGKILGTDCRMNGFDKITCDEIKSPCPKSKYLAYSYVPHSETQPYFDMGKQYVLGDEMFPSNFDISSYVSHQYIIAGQAESATNYPSINWGCPGGKTDSVPTIKEKPPRDPGNSLSPVCFTYKTLADELDAAKLSWHFYAGPLGSTYGKACGDSMDPNYTESGIWSSYQAIKDICYGPDWDADVSSSPPQILKDVAAGTLANVTWVTPYCRDSDHTGCDADGGPSWVASVVNAIGESSFWNSTAIFVFWDDPGGFFDPQPPAYVDYDGLGMRVPLLVISPYAKKGYVSHVHYEHGSILKFIENRFDLAALAASDTRATSPEKDCFDFTQQPRKFVPIKSKYDIEHFIHEPPDFRPADTN
jgi:phospholipase C